MDTAAQVSSAPGGAHLASLLPALLWITLLRVNTADAKEYHLAMPDAGCASLTTLGATVDIVCQYFDFNDYSDDGTGPSSSGRQSRDPAARGRSMSARGSTREPPCTVQAIQWQRLRVGGVYNISDSAKFGVWSAIPGWGMQRAEHVSLLRVRQMRPEDIGTYRCQLICAELNKAGHRQILERTAHLALRQPNKQYAIRGLSLEDTFCARSFLDGVCQLECDSERYLYDGYDCTTRLGRCPDDDVCKPRFFNGFCDRECDTRECGWDGGDCIHTTLRVVDGTVALFLARRQAAVTVNLKALGRALTALLQTLVRVLPGDWNGPHRDVQGRGSLYGAPAEPAGAASAEQLEHVLFLRIDNTKCKGSCIKSAENAAHFIALALQKGWDPGISVTAVTVISKLQSDEECPIENNTLLDIDLDSVDRGQPHSNGGAASGGEGEGFLGLGLQPWVLIAAVASGLALLLLILTLTLVTCRMLTHRHKRRRRDSFDLYDSTARIRSEKGPPGTDV